MVPDKSGLCGRWHGWDGRTQNGRDEGRMAKQSRVMQTGEWIAGSRQARVSSLWKMRGSVSDKGRWRMEMDSAVGYRGLPLVLSMDGGLAVRGRA